MTCAHCLDGNHCAFDADPECECGCHDQPEPEPTCFYCDAPGHGYVIGYEKRHLVDDDGPCPDPNFCCRLHYDAEPILSSPCPLEDRGWEPDYEQDALPF